MVQRSIALGSFARRWSWGRSSRGTVGALARVAMGLSS